MSLALWHVIGPPLILYLTSAMDSLTVATQRNSSSLVVGLVRCGGSVVEAAIWGSVAASFCIEQVGMPKLESHPNGEIWNGVRVQDRLEGFRQRLE